MQVKTVASVSERVNYLRLSAVEYLIHTVCNGKVTLLLVLARLTIVMIAACLDQS